MQRRQLVIDTLEHKATRPIPWHVDFTTQALERYIAYTGDLQIERKTGACLHYVQYDGWPTEMKDRPDHFRDEFGVIWNRSGADKDIGVVDKLLIEDFEQVDYTFPVCDTARLRRDIEALLADKADRFTMVAFGFCMFERAWSLAGMENVLMAMVACPDALEAFYDRICAYYLPLIDIALEYEVDGIMFGDDWGQQQGLIMGPEHWRRFIKPRMARLYARVRATGKYVIQHSCGDCSQIFPDLIEIGLSCYQTFQPEVYDIAAMKKQYGNQLTFWGGISTQQVLPVFSVAALQEEIVRVAKQMGAGGGYILAPTHALPADIPPENIKAMLEVFQQQERFL